MRKTFRRRPGRPLNVLCTFNLRAVQLSVLRPVSTGKLIPTFYNTLLPGYQEVSYYIIGDPAYPHTTITWDNTPIVLTKAKSYSLTF